MTTLQLGSGMRPMQGAVNHDRTQHHDWIDVAWDLDNIPWPFGDAAYDRVVALDVMEHLKVDVADWLAECWRILAPSGLLVLRLPAWDAPTSYRDVTHRRVFQEESFLLFDPRSRLWKDYGSFYFGPAYRAWWHVESVERVNADPRYGVGDLGFVLKKVDA